MPAVFLLGSEVAFGPTKSEIVDRWHVRAFPTYVLLDRDGTILVRTTGWSEELANLVRSAVSAEQSNP